MPQPKLTVIDTAQGIKDLRAYLSDKQIVSYDTETTGLHKTSEIIGYSVCASEDEAYYIILASWDQAVGQLKYTDLYVESLGLIADLAGKDLVMHNGVFDCMITEAFFSIRLIDSLHTDTMILAHLLDENRRVGLKDLSAHMFGESSKTEQEEMEASVLANGGQLTKDCYEMFKADPYLMGKYGAKDAWLTYKVFLTLVPDLYEQELDKFFYEEESMPLLRGPTYELNTEGLNVDVKALSTLKKTLEAECLEHKAFINSEIAKHVADKYPGTTKAKTFNVDAGQQMAWLMFGKLGLEFSKLTDGGKIVAKALGVNKVYTATQKRDFIHAVTQAKDSIYVPESKNAKTGKTVKAKKVKDPWAYIACDKTDFKKYAPKFKWIEALREYKRKIKILGTYVIGIEGRLRYGVIQPSFLMHGTSSGRFSSRTPNFQNLPRNDKRVKACISARPGRVLVGADFSQLEPRVFAYVSQDKNLMEAFNKDQDFYAVIGMDVFGKYDCTPAKEERPDSFKVKYPGLRDNIKVFALASVYGANAWRLSKDTGKSVEDTQEDLDKYFERFPGVFKMMQDAHENVKISGEIVSVFGRKRRVPDAKLIPKLFGDTPHGELDYNWRKMLNLAVNHKIQGTAANIVNRAMIAVHRSCRDARLDAKMLLQVHDSIVMECSEHQAEDVALLLQHAMEHTVELEGVPLEAIPKIGKTLAEV